MHNNTRTLFGFLLASLMTTSASAALYDRGNGMIYDSAQNITWLQDANYAKTSGYDADGGMYWSQAVTWANDLVFGGFTDWRLASARLQNLDPYLPQLCSSSYDGTCDKGCNNTRSELGHLFNELGNKASFNTSGNSQTGFGALNSVFIDAGSNQSISISNFAWAVRDGDVAPAVPVLAAAWLMGSGLIDLTAIKRRKK
jgi:hypothetical protein